MSKTDGLFISLLLVILISTPAAGCGTPLTNIISDNISTQAASKMIQSNQDNPNFVILDVRRKDEFDSGHLARAINLDVNLPDFEDTIYEQDKRKEYVVYCRTGHRSYNAVRTMEDLAFRKAFSMSGGITQWKAEGLPVINPVVNENITTQAANYMVQGNQGKKDFVVADVRRKDEFDAGHIANAVNIDYTLPDFRERIGKRDHNIKYVVYCRTGGRGSMAANAMNSLGFQQVYNITGGFNQWKADVLPATRSVVNEVIDTQTAFYILKNNRTNPDLVLIDVRSKPEFDSAHLGIAINIDLNAPDFRDKIGRLDRNKKYVVYCQDGTRSRQAARVMQDYEFWQVYDIEGGLNRWLADGLPLDSAPGDTCALPTPSYLASLGLELKSTAR